MYQVKIVKDDEFSMDIAWSEAMGWDAVVSAFIKAHRRMAGVSGILHAVNNLKAGQEIVDDGNTVYVPFHDDRLDRFEVRLAA